MSTHVRSLFKEPQSILVYPRSTDQAFYLNVWNSKRSNESEM